MFCWNSQYFRSYRKNELFKNRKMLNPDEASQYISKARLILQPSLYRNFQQSYNRAYNDLYHAQLLAELEEVMDMRKGF